MFKEYSPSLTYTLVLSLWDIFRLAPLKINKEMEIKVNTWCPWVTQPRSISRAHLPHSPSSSALPVLQQETLSSGHPRALPVKNKHQIPSASAHSSSHLPPHTQSTTMAWLGLPARNGVAAGDGDRSLWHHHRPTTAEQGHTWSTWLCSLPPVRKLHPEDCAEHRERESNNSGT